MDRKQSEKWQSRMARTANSAMCFSLAYVILTYMVWFASGLAGKLYKFDSLVYYYGIKFILNGHGLSKMKVAVVYSGGAIFVLFLALLGLFLYQGMKKIKTLLNLFFLWVFIIGIGIFISQIIVAAIGTNSYKSLYYQGLAVTFSWLKVPNFVIYLLNFLCVIFIFYIGVNIARPFLAFSYSFSKVNNLTRRRKYFFEIALVPFLVGTMLTCIAVFPKDLGAKNVLVLLGSMHLIYFLVIGLILGVALISLSYIELTKEELVRYNSLQMPSVVFLILMLVSWAYLYLMLRGAYIAG